MKKLSFTIALFLLPFISFCTCILMVQKNNVIYVAADSRRAFTITDAGYKGNNTAFDTVCKIHNYGKNYYAISGIAADYFSDIIKKNFGKYNNIDTAIVHIATDAKKWYLDQIQKLKKISNIESVVYGLNSIAEVGFFGFKAGKSYITYLTIRLKQKGVLSSIESVTAKAPENVLMGIGHHEHIKMLTNNQRGAYLKDPRGTIYGLEELLKIEIISSKTNSVPNDVAAPIDLLILEEKKTTWVRRQKKCK